MNSAPKEIELPALDHTREERQTGIEYASCDDPNDEEMAADLACRERQLLATIAELRASLTREREQAEEIAKLEARIAELEGKGDGWIDVKQELPPEGEPCLIVWSNVVQYLTYARFEGDWYPYHSDPDDDPELDEDVNEVTHWQPLPAPPAKEPTK